MRSLPAPLGPAADIYGQNHNFNHLNNAAYVIHLSHLYPICFWMSHIVLFKIHFLYLGPDAAHGTTVKSMYTNVYIWACHTYAIYHVIMSG